MRRLLTVGMSLALASLAVADGEVKKDVIVQVAHAPAPKKRVMKEATPTAFLPIGVDQSRAMMCNLQQSRELTRKLEELVNLTLSGVRTLNKEDVFVTMIDLCPDGSGISGGKGPSIGHVHGEDMQYASGLAKLFYGVSVYQLLSSNCVDMTPALQEDVMRMLRDGDNAATNRLVDFVTGTESGPDLPYPDLCDFAIKREYVNAYLTDLGFQHFNVNQKVSVGSPVGRDLQLLGRKLPLNYENSNRVTSNQVAALMYLLDQEALVSPGASHAMKAYMHRPLEQQKVRPLAGIAAGLPVGSKVVSINGYTVRNYADAAIVTLPNGVRYILAVMTKYNDYPTVFIPLLSRYIAHRQMTSTGSDDPDQHLYIAPLASH